VDAKGAYFLSIWPAQDVEVSEKEKNSVSSTMKKIAWKKTPAEGVKGHGCYSTAGPHNEKR
jgi:hypothetical protein